MSRRVSAGIIAGLVIGSMFAAGASARKPSKHSADRHRAVAITQDGHAVLRDDGRVVVFANKDTENGTDPVLVEGLRDIVDVAGQSSGMGPFALRESAFWIALRRDGTVYQWTGSCSDEGYMHCRYPRATQVAELRNIVAISSSDGVHLAVDRNGQAWGWGWDRLGVIAGSPKPPAGQTWRLIESPIRISAPAPLRSIAVGSPHALAVDQAGAVWIWSNDDPPDALPVEAETIANGPITFRKVAGLPPARSAAAMAGQYKGGGASYVVTENDELWEFGIIKVNPVNTAGSKQPHRIEGLCPVASVSVSTDQAVALCRDGSVYKQPRYDFLSPGGEEWEREAKRSEVLALHVDSIGPFNIALIDKAGAAWRGHTDSAGQLIGPLRLDR
jgi:hypothetical protein